MKRLPTLVCLFFFCHIPTAWAVVDELRLDFVQISTRDGLSQNTVRTILEDGKGFIWAGTLEGLNRYDGYNIVSHTPQPGNTGSLIDHRVKEVFEDQRGLLWIKTYNNEFCCYDPVSDSFGNYYQTSGGNREMVYMNYYESSNGDIWLWGGTDNCLRITPKKERLLTEGSSDEPQKSQRTEKEPLNTGLEKYSLSISQNVEFEISTLQTGGRKETRFLLEDSRGGIWIGGDYGLYKITVEGKEDFYRNRYSFTNATEYNDKLYFTTRQGRIVEYDIRRATFRETKGTPDRNALLNIAPMIGSELMVITDSAGILTFNTVEGTFTRPEWAKDPLLSTGEINFIVDAMGGIWVYNHSGVVWYYNPIGGKTKKMELIPPDIAGMIDEERYNILVDSEELIWITTYGNGLFCFNPRTEALYNYTYSPNRNSPASDYLLSITEDRVGNIWVGSEYAGIIKIIKSPYTLQVVRPEQETSIGKNNNVRTVHIDEDERVWIGTKNGSLYLYNKALEFRERVFKDVNPYTLEEDPQKRLWIGTKTRGLYVINMQTRERIASFRNNPADDSSLSFDNIFDILRDSQGRIWIGTFGGGLNLVEEGPEGFRFIRFFHDEGNRSYIRHLCEDRQGMIWMGTSYGVIRFNPEELLENPAAYTVYKLDLNDSNSLNCSDIKTIFEDSRGRIWIGTAGGGVSLFKPAEGNQREHFTAYTTEDGLCGNIVCGIMEDKQGHLWISTESGISRFDTDNRNFTVYQFSGKTYGNFFNENANIYGRDGNMYWGSLDGLLVFNPETFVTDENPHPVTITNFFLYDQKAEVGADGSPLKKSIAYSDRIELKHNQNTFTIEFSSLAFKDPAKNRYMYRLHHYDKQWSQVSGDNRAIYKNLPPGNYVFEVKGTNNDGVWNEEIRRLEITVIPPFWKSGWAYLLYFFFVLGAALIAIRLFVKFTNLNNNIRVEKELTNHKLRFFTNISHEFRTPLTIIRSVVENLNEQPDTSENLRKQISVLNRNSNLLTRLIDQLLEFRKLQGNVLTLDLESIDMVAFARDIHQGFSEIAGQKEIEYTFECEEESFLMFLDRRKIDKVIYNLLSNAFKFTPQGGRIKLALRFDAESKNCIISVSDNGVGIDKDKQELLFSRFMQINFSYAGTGVGLSLVKEFVDVHKGKVWHQDNETEGRGSVFVVQLSTDPEVYKGENFVNNPALPPTQPIESPVILPVETEKNIRIPEIDEETLSNYKMLIIDDNDDIREFLTDEFSKYFMVHVAEDGSKGFQKAVDLNPDLIICDVMMPGMDGFEVTKRLKDEFQTCHIPIILLTAHSSTEHQVEGIQSGADAYITKPFSIKFLVARVFKLIEQREQLKKRFSNDYVVNGQLITGAMQDKKFFEDITRIVEENLSDPEFTVDRFAELAQLRRTIFYKKIKGITGLSPNDFIKVKRLKHAAELLLQGGLTVAEISYKVGFDNPFYFSKCFKAQYNCSPSKYGPSLPDKIDPKDKSSAAHLPN